MTAKTKYPTLDSKRERVERIWIHLLNGEYPIVPEEIQEDFDLLMGIALHTCHPCHFENDGRCALTTRGADDQVVGNEPP